MAPPRPRSGFFGPRILAMVLLAMAVANPVHSLEFDMMFQTKCVMEEVNQGVLVVVDYATFYRDDPGKPSPMNVKVESPNGNVLYDQRAMTSGQYAFTANEQGDYKVCLTARDMPTARQSKIRLEWKTGVAATDWDAIAKKENLDAMGTELMRLEETVKEIHQEMLYMKKREEEMRDMNEETNSRVLWFSIGSLGICVGLGVWQLFYLKNFFRRKKLL